MRTDPRYNRVRGILSADDVPRLANGGVALCHLHQRATAFAGSFNQYLIRWIKITAGGNDVLAQPGKAPDSCPRCGWHQRYEIKTRNKYKCSRCHHHYSPYSASRFASLKIPPETLQAIIEGLSNDESCRSIAKRVGVTINTVSCIKVRAFE
jgi:hypothetical protein